MREAIAECLEPRRLLSAAPSLIFRPPRLQSVHAGVDAEFSLGRLKAVAAAGPFTVDVNWNDGSADAVVVAAKPGGLPRLPQVFHTAGIHIVDVSVKDSQGLTIAGEFEIRVLPATGGIFGAVFRDALSRPPLGGYTFYLDLNHDGKLDASDPAAVSNAQGVYRFTALLPGVYRVEELIDSQTELAAPAAKYDQVTVSGRVVKAVPFVDVLPANTPPAGLTLKIVAALGGPAQYRPSNVVSMQVDANGNIYAASDGGGTEEPHGLTSGTLFKIPAGATQLQLPDGLDWFQDDIFLFPIGIKLDGSGHFYLTDNTYLDGFGGDITSRYNASDGSYGPYFSLGFTSLPIFDQSGNGYLTAENGSFGTGPGGSVMEIPSDTGQPVSIASFNASFPLNLTQDADGNLFGELSTAPVFPDSGEYGSAQTFFEIDAGTHAISTLYTFSANDDSNDQVTDLVSDSHGDLFATTENSNNSTGTVFELPAGSRTITQLASFNSVPNSSLIFDPSGNLFGEVPAGGAEGKGEIFEVPAGTGTLSEIASFNGTDGDSPGGLIADSAGNLFGITKSGGKSNDGTAFKIAAGTFGVTTLVDFNRANGIGPSVGLYADGSGNLYGATDSGGAYGAGSIFKISGAGFISAAQPSGAGLVTNN